MSHSYTGLFYHCVFSTKNRLPQIVPDLKPRLFPYMGGIVRELHGEPLIVNGTADHVHLLLRLPPAVAVADAMRIVKTNSSRWVHETWPAHRAFGWQTGYGAFTVSMSNRKAVAEYIAAQEVRHRRMAFQQEFLGLLKKHEIEYDERYIWD